MTDKKWQLEFYEDDNGRAPCREWMSSLPPLQRAALAEALTQVLAVRGLDVCGTEWGKQLGDGLFEFRIRHSGLEIARMFGESTVADEGSRRKDKVLLRVFCHAYGRRIVLLISGYDKGAHPDKRRQEREIKAARKALTAFKAHKRRGK